MWLWEVASATITYTSILTKSLCVCVCFVSLPNLKHILLLFRACATFPFLMSFSIAVSLVLEQLLTFLFSSHHNACSVYYIFIEISVIQKRKKIPQTVTKNPDNWKPSTLIYFSPERNWELGVISHIFCSMSGRWIHTMGKCR